MHRSLRSRRRRQPVLSKASAESPITQRNERRGKGSNSGGDYDEFIEERELLLDS
jgi:hypothetical protein